MITICPEENTVAPTASDIQAEVRILQYLARECGKIRAHIYNYLEEQHGIARPEARVAMSVLLSAHEIEEREIQKQGYREPLVVYRLAPTQKPPAAPRAPVTPARSRQAAKTAPKKTEWDWSIGSF